MRSNEAMIHSIISVCCKRDSAVWQVASQGIIDNLEAKNYYVIVPEGEVSHFECISPAQYEVISERDILPNLNTLLIEKYLPEAYKYRSGWYLQQLLKIAALKKLSSDSEGLMLIWDADTVPLKKLNFFKDGRCIYFMGSEHHPPYFNSLERLLNLKKSVNFSFITQCFIFKAKWIKEFITELETLHGMIWHQAILEKSDLTHPSGFSEYETLGNWLMVRHKSEIAFNTSKWERFGSSRCGLKKLRQYEAAHPEIAFISFESWDGYMGDQDLVQMSTLGRNGRFGNQIFQYFFLCLVHDKLGYEVRFPAWVGNTIFNLKPSKELINSAFPIDWAPVSTKADTPELDLQRIQNLMSRNSTNALDISGYFQYQTKFLAPHKDLFESIFQIDQVLMGKIISQLNTFNADLIIAIHVRAGDYLDLEKENRGYGFAISPSFREIHRKIQEMLGGIGNRKALLYLASDDLDYAKNGFKQFDLDHIVSDDIFPDSDGDLNMLIDFCVLAMADSVMISNSSFSYAAAMLNKNAKNFFRPSVVDKSYHSFDPWNDHILHVRSKTLYV